MIQHIRPILPATIAATLLIGAPGTRTPVAQQPAPEPFAVAELFFELNATDEDLGIHGVVDGTTWVSLEVTAPGARSLLEISSEGRLVRQGLTQLAFESAEPSFEELTPEAFFRRFPEGDYEIAGRAHEGGRLASTVRLSHVLAAAPEATVSGLLAAESCQSPALPEVSAPVVIDWHPVTDSHPVGRRGSVTISRYQFFVEQADTKLSIDLPPSVTEVEIPLSVTAAGGVFKFEIIARTSTGNNTAVESCFKVK